MTQKPKPLHSIKVEGPIPAHLARSVIEETLRSAILDGRLPCGTALRQQDLADLFGVSRMPVREALRQLEAQELLSVTTHKGAVVAPLIQGDAAETYELRILLESEALRQSIPLLTDAEAGPLLRRALALRSAGSIMASSGTPLLLDWGLADAAGSEDEQVARGTAWMTPYLPRATQAAPAADRRLGLSFDDIADLGDFRLQLMTFDPDPCKLLASPVDEPPADEPSGALR